MNTIYDVNFFINKFEAIPEENWYTGSYHNDEKTKFCAAGLCGMKADFHTGLTPEYVDLADILLSLKITPHANSSVFYNSGAPIPMINDGETMQYQQPTPKQRILAALYDIKQQSAVNEAVAIVSQPSHETVSNEAV